MGATAVKAATPTTTTTEPDPNPSPSPTTEVDGNPSVIPLTQLTIKDNQEEVQTLAAAAVPENQTATTAVVVEEKKSSPSSSGTVSDRNVPLRSGEADSSFYLRTDTCRYGPRRRYNHPRRSSRNKAGVEIDQVTVKDDSEACQVNADSVEETTQAEVKDVLTPTQDVYKEDGKDVSPQKPGKIKCKYYFTPGGCRFGKDCKFSHSEEQADLVLVELNFLGLPLRPGEKDCPYYMQTGGCKYATRCRYHHPDPIAVSGQDMHSGYQSSGSHQLHVPGNVPLTPAYDGVPFYTTSSPFVPGMVLPPQSPFSNMQWNGYQASPYSLYPPNAKAEPSAIPLNDGSRRGDSPAAYHKALTDEYPERPGQKECSYFMKTGDCKYKSACKFHHPRSRISRTPATV